MRSAQNHIGRYACTACLFLLTTAVATADIVTRYDFTGNRGTTATEPPIETASGVTATDLVRGPGLTTGSGQEAYWDSFVSRNWGRADGTPGPGPNDYLTLTITPMSGKVVSLDSVLMGVKGNAVRELVLRSSLDGFATDIGSVMFSTTAQNRTMTFETPLMFTSPVEFRFIVKGVLNNGSRYALTSRNDGAGATAGLVFNGTVAAVPEPSSLALLGIVAAGTGGMTMWRRRNRRVAAATS